MKTIKIGKITSAVGLKGEVKIISYSDDPMRFEMLDHIFIYAKDASRVKMPKGSSSGEKSSDEALSEGGSADRIKELYIENIRYKGVRPILKLEGIDDRNAAEEVRGADIFMDEEDLPEPEEGQFYVKDIIGFEVTDEGGHLLGDLKDVVTGSAQDLYVVAPGKDSGRAKDILIPGVPEFILTIDTDKKEIMVKLPEGLMDI